MYKKITAVLLGAMFLAVNPVGVMADTVEDADVEEIFCDDSFSDGTETTGGVMSSFASEVAQKAEAEAKEYQEKKAEAEAVIEKRKAEEAEAARKAAEEEAARKAEEEAGKAEEARVAKRQEIVDFALQFVGNPYVYGGTSLTNGADCSGFVMSVFSQFGYELPRVAADQCNASQKKAVEDIEAGDLVFYGDGGIDHVALYIGDGRIVHASTAATGIKVSDYNYRAPAAVGTFVE